MQINLQTVTQILHTTITKKTVTLQMHSSWTQSSQSQLESEHNYTTPHG